MIYTIPVSVDADHKEDQVLRLRIDPENIFKLKFKTIGTKEVFTAVLPYVNIKEIKIHSNEMTENIIDSNVPTALFEVDFGRILTNVEITIKFDYDFRSVSSGYNDFYFLFLTNETTMETKKPLIISKTTMTGNDYIVKNSLIKEISIKADSSNPYRMQINAYSISDNSGNISGYIDPGETFLLKGTFCFILLGTGGGLVTDYNYSAVGITE